MGVMFVPLLTVVFYFLNKDPELLERRLRYKEKEAKEIAIIKVAQLFFFIGFNIPRHRLQIRLVPRSCLARSPLWCNNLPSIYACIPCIQENSYTSRIVEVDKKQKVITTGPYSIVSIRCTQNNTYVLVYPLALGSYYAVAFFIRYLLIFYRYSTRRRCFCRS